MFVEKSSWNCEIFARMWRQCGFCLRSSISIVRGGWKKKFGFGRAFDRLWSWHESTIAMVGRRHYSASGLRGAKYFYCFSIFWFLIKCLKNDDLCHIAKHLIEKGANVSLRNDAGETPLVVAVEVGDFVVVVVVFMIKLVTFPFHREKIQTPSKLFVCFYSVVQIDWRMESVLSSQPQRKQNAK